MGRRIPAVKNTTHSDNFPTHPPLPPALLMFYAVESAGGLSPRSVSTLEWIAKSIVRALGQQLQQSARVVQSLLPLLLLLQSALLIHKHILRVYPRQGARWASIQRDNCLSSFINWSMPEGFLLRRWTMTNNKLVLSLYSFQFLEKYLVLKLYWEHIEIIHIIDMFFKIYSTTLVIHLLLMANK